MRDLGSRNENVTRISSIIKILSFFSFFLKERVDFIKNGRDICKEWRKRAKKC